MKIALCADLHFGSVPVGLEDALREAMEAERPDVIVVAGDLTLRARRREFEAAKTWLAALRTPALVLPGNHDLPYFNLLQRFADPFHRFHQATGTPHLMPVFEGGGAVLGFNTARSWQPHLRWQEGAARRRDIAAAEAEFAAMPPGAFKAVAAHHPFLRVPGEPRARPVRRADEALRAFARSGVALLMSGHTHRSFAIEAQAGGGGRLVALGAPTALSSRMRGEANGFWIVEADAAAIACTLWLREIAPGRADRFSPSPTKSFARG